MINYVTEENINSLLILCLLFFPVVLAILNWQIQKNHYLINTLNITFTLFTFVSAINLTNSYLNGNFGKFTLFEVVPGLTFNFMLEPLGLIFILFSSFLWIVTAIYAIGYLSNSEIRIKSRFYIYLALSMEFVFVTALAGNLFTLITGYELITIFTYPLVTLYKNNKVKKAGRVYLIYLLGTSLLLLLPAVIIIYSNTGFVDFQYKKAMFDNINLNSNMIALLFAMTVLGASKCAIMPLHSWLPAAMVAPTPVSALLHAVAVVKAGIYTILKIIIYVFGVERLHKVSKIGFFEGSWLLYLAAFTIIASSLAALRQKKIKKLLAFSTVTQLSICLIATSIFTYKAILAAILHMVTHAFGKITLFFAAGSIYTSTHKRDIREFNGLSKVIPITMIAFTLGALSLIGLPIFAGFISKFYIYKAAWENDYILIVLIMILTTFISAAYYLPIIYQAFFGKPEGDEIEVYLPRGESHVAIRLALILCSTFTVLIILFFNHILKFAERIFV